MQVLWACRGVYLASSWTDQGFLVPNGAANGFPSKTDAKGADIATQPLAFDNAPYLTALVQSSLRIIASGRTAEGLTSISGISTEKRAPLSNGSIEVRTIVSSFALVELVFNNKSCTRPNASKRCSIASRPCSTLSTFLKLCDAIAITVASTFFIR